MDGRREERRPLTPRVVLSDRALCLTYLPSFAIDIQ